MVTKKEGFTVPEILIVLLILSLLIVLMLTLVKPNNVVLKLQYYKAYDVLATAVYNIYENSSQENIIMYEDKVLCEKLSEYINFNGNTNCSNEKFVNLSGKSFDSENIQITSSNGMLFYFSKSIEIKINEKSQKHRIVWVDINGKRRPNTAKWTKSTPADIVAFDITDTGEVIPLGYPKFDKRYILAKVVYPSEFKDVNTYTYYEAQKKAFGSHEYDYDVFSYNIENLQNFKDSVLYVDSEFKYTILQSSECQNAEDEKFPKCSIEIIK